MSYYSKYLKIIQEEYVNHSRIEFSDLQKETQRDIANIISDYHPVFKNTYYFSHPDRIIEFIGGTLNMYITSLKVNPYKYIGQVRNISDKVVEQYTSEIENGTEFDPILIAGDKFIDGNHRLVAYTYAEKNLIPAVDISNILNFDWETEVREAFG